MAESQRAGDGVSDPQPTRPSPIESTREGSESFAWGVVVVTFAILGAAIVMLVMA